MHTAPLSREQSTTWKSPLQIKFLTTIQDNTSEPAQGKPTREIAGCSLLSLRGTIHSQLEFNLRFQTLGVA